ncbi:MAG: DNA repair protein RadA [Gammaproteobacteria bacterium]|nr:DNA repair protein RadA [Gammaproteobacteria bacterium]
MAKARTSYVCNECGARQPKWQGQCPDCGAWNSLSEAPEPRPAAANPRGAQYAGETARARLAEVSIGRESRVSTGFDELDRVLGGGLVAGSVNLIGGDPGVGKSTLLLQAACHLARRHPTCYVTGEESLAQIALRAQRLGIADAEVELVSETCVERIIAALEAAPPSVLVIDSVQTLWTETLNSAPGSVAQLRESTARLVRFAKQRNVAVFLVGHVTKEGAIAGPRVLEHMVDGVLYFESDAGSRFRILRAVKNRFGAANEIGVFAMAQEGFREVKNPSAIFLSRQAQAVAGSAVMVTWEGSRPLLVEVQALVDDAAGSHPRRVAVGTDGNRLALLLAVLHRHAGIAMMGEDVYVNVVGGVRISETAADLALLMAALSSYRDRPLARDLVVFGELGLAGEIRPVPYGEERISEAAKHGFRHALVPRANAPRRAPGNIEVHAVERLADAVDYLFS